MENKLQVFNPKSLQQLSKVEFLTKNLDNLKIKQVNRPDLVKYITLFVIELEEHFAPDKKTEDLIIRDILEMISSVFKTLSLDEIYYASKLKRYGQIGALNKSYGRITTEFVSQMLVDYKNWKRETLRQHNLPISKMKPEKTIKKEEKEMLIHHGLVTCFDAFKQTNEIPLGYIWVYDHLDDINVINFSADEKKSIMPIALERLKKEVKQSRGYSDYKLFLKTLESGNYNKKQVVNKAKEMLLERFFLSLIAKDKHIKDLL